MPQFAANLTLLYPELPFLERFEAAARDGFGAVECLFPYAWPADELRARLRGNGLKLVLFNAPPGGTSAAEVDAQWQSGARGTGCLAKRADEWRWGVQQALRYAEALECSRIHGMAGNVPNGVSHAEAGAVFRRHLA